MDLHFLLVRKLKAASTGPLVNKINTQTVLVSGTCEALIARTPAVVRKCSIFVSPLLKILLLKALNPSRTCVLHRNNMFNNELLCRVSSILIAELPEDVATPFVAQFIGLGFRVFVFWSWTY